MSNVRDSQLPILVDLFLNSLLFQTAEERFGDGIVPAVALPAHARLEVIGAAEPAPRVAAVLRALIGMNHRAARSSSPHRHKHGVQHEFAAERRPADQPTTLREKDP